MRPEVRHEEHAAGTWPNAVGVVREVRLSEDLARMESRRVSEIKVYDGNAVALSLSVVKAKELRDSLDAAIEQAVRGPLGDLS
jgi:hypothetical protein